MKYEVIPQERGKDSDIEYDPEFNKYIFKLDVGDATQEVVEKSIKKAEYDLNSPKNKFKDIIIGITKDIQTRRRRLNNGDIVWYVYVGHIAYEDITQYLNKFRASLYEYNNKG